MDSPPPPTALRVLVVDDNPDAAATLAEALRLAGHEAEVAWNGLDALEAAREARPDVVVLDLGMPFMNGFETAHRLRDAWPADPPVLIALTGWDGDGDRRRTAAAGFAHHLVKPADPAAVVGLVAGYAGGPVSTRP